MAEHAATGIRDPGYGIAPPGYRLPAETRLGPVRLQVADLVRSREYYRRVIGLRALSESAGAVSLGGPDGTPLVELRERRGASPVPRRGRLGLYHFAILLPDRASLAGFLQHVAAENVPAGMSDHYVSEAIYLTDPDGLGIEIYADRPRSAWRRVGRELALHTEPLKADDLLRVAGDEPWTGLPPGTVMGHVHLHVGDLDRAAAFYHEGLGLDKVVWSYPGALFLSAGGYHHHLGTNVWAAGAPAAGEADARLLEWTISLPDASEAEAAARSLEAAGHQVSRAGRDWIATDPWGTRLRLHSRARAGDLR